MIGYNNKPLHFGLECTVPPTDEPVTRNEAKAWCRQELDFTDEDDLFDSLISTAREYAELKQRRQLMPATYVLQLDQFPVGGYSAFSAGPAIVLPMPRLRTVASLVYLDQSGTPQTLSSSRYVVDTVSQPGRVSPVLSVPWPVARSQPGSVTLTFTAGYDDASKVPSSTKTAMKMLIDHWYKNRSAIGNVGGPLEFSVNALLARDAVATVR